MPLNVKALIVVAGLSGLAFLWLLQSKALPVASRDIRVWGVGWLLVTCAGFLVPNYWLFLLFVAVVCIVGSGKAPDRKVAFYFLLLPAMPMMQQQIPASVSSITLQHQLRAALGLDDSFAACAHLSDVGRIV